MDAYDFHLNMEIRRYRMLTRFVDTKKKDLKRLRKAQKTCTGTFESAHNRKNQALAKASLEKMKSKVKKIERAIYFDPNTFDADVV